jgi:hypothetical protein
MTVVLKSAVAAVIVAATAMPALAHDWRYDGGPRRYVYVDDVRNGIHCYGGYVYAGPYADSCAFWGPVPYARAIDPYYYGIYGPRLRYPYKPFNFGFYYRPE